MKKQKNILFKVTENHIYIDPKDLLSKSQFGKMPFLWCVYNGENFGSRRKNFFIDKLPPITGLSAKKEYSLNNTVELKWDDLGKKFTNITYFVQFSLGEKGKYKKINPNGISENEYGIPAKQLVSNGKRKYTIYWHVIAKDGIDESASIPASFIIEKPNRAPTPPRKLSVNSKSIQYGKDVTFSWGASTDLDGDSVSYFIEYKRMGDDHYSKLDKEGMREHSKTYSTRRFKHLRKGENKIFWRVGATNSIDTSWSNTAKFYIYRKNSPPTAPILLSDFSHCMNKNSFQFRDISWQAFVKIHPWKPPISIGFMYLKSTD